jgi:hypothetical protein
VLLQNQLGNLRPSALYLPLAFNTIFILRLVLLQQQFHHALHALWPVLALQDIVALKPAHADVLEEAM